MPCQFTKSFLNDHEIDFIEKNIEEDESALEEVKSLGFQAVPVVSIEGHPPFQGFNPDRLTQLIEQ